jgi:hypothetical protein
MCPVHPRGPRNSKSQATHVFRCEGDYWTIIYDGKLLRLRDAKGLRLLAVLLHNPRKRLSALELLANISPPTGEEAQAQTARAQRPDDAALERARLTVTKRIKEAIRNIEHHHPSLGLLLRATIRTGATCVCLIPPELGVTWTD